MPNYVVEWIMAEGSDLLRLAVAKGDRSLARTLLSEELTTDVDKVNKE